MTKLSKEAMREYMKKRRANLDKKVGEKAVGLLKEAGFGEGRALEAQPGSGETTGGSDESIAAGAGSTPARPVGVGSEAWEECLARAARAQRYAGMYPEKVRPSEEVYRDPVWQWENEVCKRVVA